LAQGVPNSSLYIDIYISHHPCLNHLLSSLSQMSDNDAGTVQPSEAVTLVLDSFQDPAFAYKVDTFKQSRLEEFAKVTHDGSIPHEWTFTHRKYKKLYEEQMESTLEKAGVNVEEFMAYMEQCVQAYSGQPGYESFDLLMATLTASEDFDAFCKSMFELVHENWVPDENDPGRIEGFVTHEISIQIPLGAVAQYNTYRVAFVYLGMEFSVDIPETYQPGEVVTWKLDVPKYLCPRESD